jgi:hypothetical protein
MNAKRINFSVADFEKHMNSLPATVNVVGNAKSLLDKKLGSKIDKHYTLRFNWPRYKNYPDRLGTRCDWLHTNYIERLDRSYIDGSFLLSANREIVDRIINSRISKGVITFLPKEITNHYNNIYPQDQNSPYLKEWPNKRQRPSLGHFFLSIFSDYRPDITLNIYGFDFKQTPTHYVNYPTEMNNHHNFYFEQESILDFIKHNNWNYIK